MDRSINDLYAAGGFGRSDFMNLFTLEPYFAFILRVHAGYDFDQSRFAAAVLAGQAHHFSGTHGKVYVDERVYARKDFEMFSFQVSIQTWETPFERVCRPNCRKALGVQLSR